MKHAAGWLLRLGVSALALWLVFRQVHPAEVLKTLPALPFPILGACLLLLGPNLFFQFMKWRTLLHSLPEPPSAGVIVRSLLLGILLGLVTPGRVGEHARVLVFTGVSRTRLAALSLLDRLASSLVTVVAGMVCLLLLPSSGLPRPLGIGLYLVGGLSLLAHLGVAGLLIDPARVLGFVSRWKRLADHPRWQAVNEGLAAVDAPRRAALVGWSWAFWTCFILQFSLLVTGLGVFDARVPAAAGATFLVTSLVPISLGDLGLRELASGALFSTLGADPAKAVSASLLLFVINVLLPALVAVPLLFRPRVQP